MDSKTRVSETLEDITHALRVLADAGWKGFDCSNQSLATLTRWQKAPVGLKETLEDIRADLGDCRRCQLSKHRTNIVFGTGNPRAGLVFVGEGPGFDEDRKGEPFVGAAGKMLTRIIEAMTLSREQVYICNIIKCRPPGNRDPGADEINTCSPFLARQLKAIDPDFIVALGSFAARTLLETTLPISKLRGRFHDYKGVKLMPTFHPAFLLRNPDKKRDVWEDIKKLMGEMGISSEMHKKGKT
jgi:DNA polymerase